VEGYRRDLAWIHDAGFSGYALGAAPGLLRMLRRHGIAGGLVVDLGCGSGRWARELTGAGYQVLGLDQSPDMILLSLAEYSDACDVAHALLRAAPRLVSAPVLPRNKGGDESRPGTLKRAPRRWLRSIYHPIVRGSVAAEAMRFSVRQPAH